jgi:galactokinase
LRPADRAAQAFAAEYGHMPTGVWSAPGRVNLIGEHTDYNEGFVLPFALPHRTAVAVAPRSDGRISMATLGNDGRLQRSGSLTLEQLAPGSIRGWAAYPAGVAWVLNENGLALGGADLVIAGDVPAGAGLSSSHALECSVALALLDTSDRVPDGPNAPELHEIAQWVQRAENEFVGAPTGLLDQTASLACKQAHALFFDVRSGQTQQIPFDMTNPELELLVIDTRTHHTHSASGYGERRRGCERAAELLKIAALRDLESKDLSDALSRLPEDLRPLVRHVVTENERVLATVKMLRASQFAEIGPLLTASHVSLRDDYRISCKELDLAVETALDSGALGARMTGGGFGGSAIALVRSRTREQIEHAVLSAFTDHGLATPRMFTAVPSAGAGRDQQRR